MQPVPSTPIEPDCPAGAWRPRTHSRGGDPQAIPRPAHRRATGPEQSKTRAARQPGAPPGLAGRCAQGGRATIRCLRLGPALPRGECRSEGIRCGREQRYRNRRNLMGRSFAPMRGRHERGFSIAAGERPEIQRRREEPPSALSALPARQLLRPPKRASAAGRNDRRASAAGRESGRSARDQPGVDARY